MGFMNRITNAGNRYQGSDRRVLCVCSAGLLRSPTAARILSAPPFNFNTRAAGVVADYALIHADQVLISWADDIVCMEPWMVETIRSSDVAKNKNIHCLDVEDNYAYMDPSLVGEMLAKLEKIYGVYHPESVLNDVRNCS